MSSPSRAPGIDRVARAEPDGEAGGVSALAAAGPDLGTEQPSLSIEVVNNVGDWPIDAAALETLVAETAQALVHCIQLPAPTNWATFAIVDDARLQSLNATWRGQDKRTDVLSFANNQPSVPGQPQFLGDVIMAADTVRAEAKALGQPLDNHVRHLVLHGLLHLLGFDHETSEDALEMEGLESEILAKFGIADPYNGRPQVATDAIPGSVRKFGPTSSQSS